jgi:hypothetical protein
MLDIRYGDRMRPAKVLEVIGRLRSILRERSDSEMISVKRDRSPSIGSAITFRGSSTPERNLRREVCRPEPLRISHMPLIIGNFVDSAHWQDTWTVGKADLETHQGGLLSTVASNVDSRRHEMASSQSLLHQMAGQIRLSAGKAYES